MERKRRKEEKTSLILKLTIKIGLIFFWRKNYCPTLLELILHNSSVLSDKDLFFKGQQK